MTYQVAGLSIFQRIGLPVFVTALIGIILILVVADTRDTTAHLDRMRLYEKDLPFKPRRGPLWGTCNNFGDTNFGDTTISGTQY